MPANHTRTKTGITCDGAIKHVSVSEEQLEQWDTWAEELDITRSEFVRCAVNVGAKKLDVPDFGEEYEDSSRSYRTEIVAAVRDGASDQDAIVKAVLAAIKDDVRDNINDLMTTGQLEYDAHKGGIHIPETADLETEDGDDDGV